MRRKAFAVALVAGAIVPVAIAHPTQKTCWPGATIPGVTIPAITIPAVSIPGVTIPATTIPRTCIGGYCTSAQHLPAQYFPAQHLPAQHIAGGCFDVGAQFAPRATTVRVTGYGAIDPSYSAKLSRMYWSLAGSAVSVPDTTAAGFGGFNAAGFPKDQYVRPYVRSNGTFVNGYWRNSPTDGLPTCQIISC
jgi:hypothetical protein